MTKKPDPWAAAIAETDPQDIQRMLVLWEDAVEKATQRRVFAFNRKAPVEKLSTYRPWVRVFVRLKHYGIDPARYFPWIIKQSMAKRGSIPYPAQLAHVNWISGWLRNHPQTPGTMTPSGDDSFREVAQALVTRFGNGILEPAAMYEFQTALIEYREFLPAAFRARVQRMTAQALQKALRDTHTV